MKIIFLSLLTIISFTGTAQTEKKWKSATKSASMTPFLGIGVSFQQFSGLNSRIAAFPQYQGLRDYMGTLSLGSRNVKRNFISEFIINGSNSMSGNRKKRSSNLRSLGAQLNLGYDVIPSDKIMLYPMAGIGFEGYQAKFYRDNSTVSFNDVLGSTTTQNAITAVKFTNSFVTYNVGLGFNFSPAKHNCNIGIQASYSGSFNSQSWKSSDRQSLANAPEDRLSRFQVGLVLSSKSSKMMK